MPQEFAVGAAREGHMGRECLDLRDVDVGSHHLERRRALTFHRIGRGGRLHLGSSLVVVDGWTILFYPHTNIVQIFEAFK